MQRVAAQRPSVWHEDRRRTVRPRGESHEPSGGQPGPRVDPGASMLRPSRIPVAPLGDRDRSASAQGGVRLAGLDPGAPAPAAIDEHTAPLGGEPGAPQVTAPEAGSGSGATGTSAAGGPAPAAAGSATATPAGIDVSVFEESGPTWSADGAFDWRVRFRTTGRSGWIVQELINTVNVTNSAGAAVNTSAVVPHYWEAWAVDGAGNISPHAGKVHDMWIRPNWGASTKGHWTMSGRMHFTTTDPATQGFTPGGVSNAGILLSTATAPAGLGPIRRWRVAYGSWDDTSTPAKPHRGHWG